MPLIARCGIGTVCVTRPSADAESAERHDRIASDRRYSVLVRESDERTEVAIQEFVRLDDSCLDRLGTILSDPATALVTTAVGCTNLETLVPALSDLLDRRSGYGLAEPLFVIACENSTESAYASLRDSGIRDVHFLDCVVDRICYRVVDSPIDNAVEVEVERYASWTIELPSSVPQAVAERLMSLLAPAIDSGEVVIVPALGPHRAKKRWLVNGPHLALAILARASEARPYIYLDEFVRERPGVVRQVVNEYLDRLALDDHGLDAAECEAFSDSIVTRFAQNPDEVDRIMRRFTSATLEEFIRQDLFAKVCAPAEALSRQSPHTWPPGMTQAVSECLRMVSAGDDYVQVG